ncbi:hypothetical protein POM88_045093 [Heracleum sosnowskyi]|uniref:EIPR1-like beta-propeller domain-containing protein n=1 Tax=Heracleum sosnowskyi TaxID=360622 RepID=A0AAD8M5S0_9APIA|nr:hypothetical protein POM88_045093 [Heracleum sosnowskyi]
MFNFSASDLYLLQARCIVDVKADTDHTSFITVTLSLKDENEVHLIRLSSSGTELVCEALFSHPNEIWDLASCPFNQRIFSIVFSYGESHGAGIWQIPELYGELNSPQLEKIASLDAHKSKPKWFLDIAAQEADGESDSSSIDSFINDQREHLEDEILSTAIVKHETETTIDLPFIQNVDDMSLEVLERMILERYKPGSSLISYAEDEAEELIDQNIDIPSLEYASASKVPIIWKVKCKVLWLISDA